eukprot:SAG22_NODE_3366_length_1756_cov_630.472541_3_plen_63_part_00
MNPPGPVTSRSIKLGSLDANSTRSTRSTRSTAIRRLGTLPKGPVWTAGADKSLARRLTLCRR